MGEEETAAFYDEFVEYQCSFLRDPNRRLRRVQEQLQPLLARKPSAALDVGCGIGIMSGWLAKQLPVVVGVDISPRSIEVARRLYPSPRFEVCALPRDPLPGHSYDLVLLVDVLEHFPPGSLRAVFQRIHEVASEDAMVVANLPSKRFALSKASGQVIDEAVDFGEVVSEMGAFGLEPLSITRYGVDFTNQYVFGAFSRSYDVSSVAPSKVLERFRDRLWVRRMNRISRSEHLVERSSQ